MKAPLSDPFFGKLSDTGFADDFDTFDLVDPSKKKILGMDTYKAE